MSTPEPTGGEQLDARSSIKLTRNAKGETQIEVKIRVGDTEAEVDQARDLAVRTYQELQRNFGTRAA